MTDDDAILFLEHISADAYMDALRKVECSDNELQMLRTHYDAPQRTITATQMALALGYGHFGAANLHYGKLARRIGEQLGVDPETGLYVIVAMEWPKGECEWTMRPQVAEALEALLWLDKHRCSLAEEVTTPKPLTEGSVFRIEVNAYERSPVARQRCIESYGAKCFVCRFDFGEVYGPLAEGYIHVHHLRPLSEIAQNYVVDPVNDLRPVCPNCHAVLHLRKPPYSIEEIDNLLRLRRAD
ncbi:MAG TPA: hypothetical protein VGZ47_21900 [Gemmataceae bacterium]|jgi:putative restriction endonuclease|nr:hypothetical protein [Gemmataceae bacterium]